MRLAFLSWLFQDLIDFISNASSQALWDYTASGFGFIYEILLPHLGKYNMLITFTHMHTDMVKHMHTTLNAHTHTQKHTDVINNLCLRHSKNIMSGGAVAVVALIHQFP